MAKGWSAVDAPAMDGRISVVTGANSGVGLETARHLARLGASVVLACRNRVAAEAARRDIAHSVPGAELDVVRLDLSDLASVAAAAAEIRSRYARIDVLVNNAGVMAGERELTADGFEMDFGTSFLGHFALTGALLDTLCAADAARVVTVGSAVHRGGRIDFDDLTMAESFTAAGAYARAKLAQMVWAVELQRRFTGESDRMISVMAHPGATHSGVMRDQNAVLGWLFTTPSLHWLRRTFIMDGPQGSLSSLRAATDPDVLGGQYYGPVGRRGLYGPPELILPAPRTFDHDLAVRLWDKATELTGVDYAFSG